jgi:hypothetical protein
MKKDQMLEHWQAIPANQPILISAVEYKHRGSTYDEDGIRITGSQHFIDSVLSRLKDLLGHENDETRLQVVYKQSQDKNTGALLNSYNCYIQVHQRGGEAIMCNLFVRGIKERNFKEYNQAAMEMTRVAAGQ